MKNRAFEDAFSEIRLSGEAKERIVDAALSAEAAGSRRAGRPGVRPVQRAVRVALAAVLAVCVLGGTALAVSPSLRELLWGGFEPYVQTIESTPENTQVYDGVEARIVSALSDGYMNVIHLDFRDLEGNRMEEAWREYQETGDMELDMWFHILADEDDLWDDSDTGTGRSVSNGGGGYPPKPVAFDEESGVMTIELVLGVAIPLDVERNAVVNIKSGSLGTELTTVERREEGPWHTVYMEDGVVISDESGIGRIFYDTVNGWELKARFDMLPTRIVDVEAAELGDENLSVTSVDISELGITVNRAGEDRPSIIVGDLYGDTAVTLRDGTVIALDDYNFADFAVNGQLYKSDIWRFPEPLDPESVVSLTVGGVEIPLN